MKVFTLTTSLWLPQHREEIFPFFADAANLETITPGYLNFRILTPLPIEMKPGALIDYRLRLNGLPIRWRTRISAWEPPYRFIDEQLRGPYRQWIHEHTFEEVDGGTLCHDRVDYAVPGGTIIDRLFVRRRVIDIFSYRQEVLNQQLAQGRGRLVQTPQVAHQPGTSTPNPAAVSQASP